MNLNITDTDLELIALKKENAELRAENERLKNGGWISVSERLPGPNTPVLVCFNLLEPIFCKNRKVEKYGLIEIDHIIEYPTDNFRWNDDTYHLATHWMPLPQPPENKEDKNGIH
jgi:hypothetical protein